MAVPAHDTRDWEFAKKFDLPIIEVVKGGNVLEEAFTDCATGEMVNSGMLNGLSVEEAKVKIIAWLTEEGKGRAKVNYKLRDWVFSRQRYWGEPIPIVHCEKCGFVPLNESDLPLKLPMVESYEPTDNGESPLANMTDWISTTCPCCGGTATRETDTMPQWAGSSWYFLRYIDPNNDKAFADSDKLKYWLPVDWYNGGMEHVTRHMIYSRFWHKFLFDEGLVPCDEPYAKRTAQGLILGPDGEKMSKSKGNVVDPNDVVDEYGADVLRTYVLFMGDYASAAPWNESSMKGCKRFLERVSDLSELVGKGSPSDKVDVSIHKTIKKVSSDIEDLKFNTAIAAMMTMLNEIYDAGTLTKDQFGLIIRLLCPFAPHLSEELWQSIGGNGLCSLAPWPEYDEEKTKDSEIEVAVQVLGKLRATVMLPADCDKETALETAKKDPRVVPFLDEKTIVKEIWVPGKIINFVVK